MSDSTHPQASAVAGSDIQPTIPSSRKLTRVVTWKRALLVIVLLLIPLLTLYNLDATPRPWHDEGGALSLAKTLVQDGIYAIRNADGYQTFGTVQSMGPTVILPVAAAFKVFGVGIVQGRLIAVAYAALAAAALYFTGRQLFGARVAVVGLVLLLSTMVVRYLVFGRELLGEVPSMALFLLGWLLWWRGVRAGGKAWFVAAGVLTGAAMITKSQLIVLGFGTLAVLFLLDLLYYRQRQALGFVILGGVAAVCVGAWYAWQYFYFGPQVFGENLVKLGELAKQTSGLNAYTIDAVLRYVLGPGLGYFFFFWGIIALVYGAALSLARSRIGLGMASLVVFSLIGLAYAVLWSNPWPVYFIAPGMITALLVAKLWSDLVGSLWESRAALFSEVRQGRPGKSLLAVMLSLTIILTLVTTFQKNLRTDVLDRDDTVQKVAAYLTATIDRQTVIETWERELFAVSDHNYHFPDQSLLAQTHAAHFRGGPEGYELGADYFRAHPASYLIRGWYARLTTIYDEAYLAEHAELVDVIGSDEGRYEVFRLKP
jgi:4-amino-4-deoxy-L-arabinose transferase-like glycosyltransferase